MIPERLYITRSTSFNWTLTLWMKTPFSCTVFNCRLTCTIRALLGVASPPLLFDGADGWTDLR